MSEEGQAADKPVEKKKGAANNQAGAAPVKPQGDGAGDSPGSEPAANSGDKASQSSAVVAAEGLDESLKQPTTEMVKRRSRWQSSLAALRYVSSVSRDNEVQVRDTDRATSLALTIVCILALAALVLPMPWLAQHRLPFVLASDVLVGVALLMHVSNRFGIVTTLTPRQALLCWQLMLGSSLLGIFLAVNLGLIIAVVIANTPRITIPQ